LKAVNDPEERKEIEKEVEDSLLRATINGGKDYVGEDLDDNKR
jgi:hypothetical protein